MPLPEGFELVGKDKNFFEMPNLEKGKRSDGSWKEYHTPVALGNPVEIGGNFILSGEKYYTTPVEGSGLKKWGFDPEKQPELPEGKKHYGVAVFNEEKKLVGVLVGEAETGKVFQGNESKLGIKFNKIVYNNGLVTDVPQENQITVDGLRKGNESEFAKKEVVELTKGLVLFNCAKESADKSLVKSGEVFCGDSHVAVQHTPATAVGVAAGNKR